jgi:aminoglycoside 6'-N-acetyltransferase I
MKIVKISLDDFNEWLDLALRLWPEYSSIEMQDILTEILDADRQTAFLMRDNNAKAIAFMNLSLRYEYPSFVTLEDLK